MLDDAASDGFAHVVPSVAMLGTLTLYADAAAQTRHVKAATPLYERMEPLLRAGRLDGGAGLRPRAGCGSGLLAEVLGEHERADEHLRFACEFHEANDMPLWTARGHLGWAEALAARAMPSARASTRTRAGALARARLRRVRAARGGARRDGLRGRRLTGVAPVRAPARAKSKREASIAVRAGRRGGRSNRNYVRPQKAPLVDRARERSSAEIVPQFVPQGPVRSPGPTCQNQRISRRFFESPGDGFNQRPSGSRRNSTALEKVAICRPF